MISSKLFQRISEIKLVSIIKNVRILRDCSRKIDCIGILHFEYLKSRRVVEENSQFYFPIYGNQPMYDQKRFYSNLDRKNIKLNIKKSKQLLKDNLEIKRLKMRERKETLVQGIRDKQTMVQEKVRAMEEIVERENILTIPNLLSVARSFLAPYIGYTIIQGHYQLAIGLLVFAGLTDLVSLFIAFGIKFVIKSCSINKTVHFPLN